jgi:outer membrane protein OmpA-like peptidoglycan-associated protein
MKKYLVIFTWIVVICGFWNEAMFAQSTQQERQLRSRKGQINKWNATANTAFAEGRYFKAFGYYDRAFQREKEGPFKMQLRQRLGETQRRLNNPAESVTYFDRVWESGNRETEFMRSYGDVLLKTANYPKAEQVYQVLFRQDTNNVLMRNRLESAKLGVAYSDSIDIVFRDQIKRQERISTPFSQYGMVIVDGKLVYSSAQRVKPAMTDQRTGHGFSHLYMATMRPDSLIWEHPRPLSFNIWGDHINDGVFTYDHTNKIGYFQRCNDGNCGIFTTTFENGDWTIPQPFKMNGVAAENVVGHPAISPDGKRLIFTTRAEGGQGGSDLWMTSKIEKQAPAPTGRRRGASSANPAASRGAASAATRQTTREGAAPLTPAQQRAQAQQRGRTPAAPPAIINNQDWNVPVNLGKVINTPGDEVFPIWINDYAIAFSSNGHVGYGGLDIYVALADSNWNFNELHHLQPPINSSFDDYTLVISPDIDHVFFSSSRNAGFMFSDEIYSFPKTAAVLQFQFTVTDKETEKPLVNATISVCNRDTCMDLNTDEFGKAELTTPKTASAYTVFTEKEDFFNDTVQLAINQAFDIIPLRDTRQVNIALQRDTTNKIEFDSIPARWEFLANNLEEDLIDIIAVATLDTLAQLIGLSNVCVRSLQITLNPSTDFTQVGGIRAMDTLRSRDTTIQRIQITEIFEAAEISDGNDSTNISTSTIENIILDTCTIFYHENEPFFAIPIVAHVDGEFTISGTMNYIIIRPDSTFVFTNVPFSIAATGKAKPPVEEPVVEEVVEEEQPVLEEAPPIMWITSVNQTRGSDEVELVVTAVFRPDAFLVASESEQLSAVAFNFIPDADKFELIGEPTTNKAPLSLSPETDPFLTAPISVFIDSVIFTQRIHITSEEDFRIAAIMSYTLGFDRMIDLTQDTLDVHSPNNYQTYSDVQISFPIFGLREQPEQPEEIVEEAIEIAEIEEDLSWADGLTSIETPDFSTYKISMHECDSINLMAECMRPGMTPEQIIDCIDRRRRDCEGLVDTRFVDNYKDRINDPNRRANLTVLPPGTPCIDCGKEPQRHNSSKPLFIQGTDDKQTLRFTDNAGNTTFFDLAPNTRYEIQVQNLMIGDVAALPSHLSSSDIVKTVTTRDYIIFECVPKLSEIGDENYINNIYFDFDQSDIIRDGHRELDRLIIIAIKNPHLKFEITSHTDERGSVDYNQALSERRLSSVLDYIRKKGMDAARLLTNAVGKSDPLIVNAQTDAEHALNRRTTIRLYDPNATHNLGFDYELKENSPLNKKGLYFRVQIAAYREAPEYPIYLFSDYLKAAQGTELTFFQDRDGLFKFTFGEFTDLKQARQLNQRILDANLESYVVPFMDGQRITVSEAIAIMNRQARK